MKQSNTLADKILQLQDADQAVHLARFFKTAPGQYGYGDCFLGVRVPQTRAVVRELWRTSSFGDLDQCLASPFHEVRLAALLALVQHYRHARRSPDLRKQCVDFYLDHLPAVNNWDLVDLSCYEILGDWLLDKDAALLRRLAAHGRTLWEQRIGIVSTMQFLRHGRLDDTYAIADLLTGHPHDLIHKATGWLLREAGKRDPERLRDWLAGHYASLPRTLLRYAIEKFPSEERQAWLRGVPSRPSRAPESLRNTLQLGARAELRRWLADHHDKEPECWVVCYRSKAAPSYPAIAYRDIVEEALCFGWIDSSQRRLADGRLLQRLSPRRKGSRWSQPNIQRFLDLERRGLATPAGRHAFALATTHEETSGT